ncbi:energy transducer TonB [Hymenobacter sp. HDW8]|uniref:energy transducer TonB n=1 Tax=Hymenobacter sp. HDW8 TaxID=2714932 RepID=UPI00140C2522|nr:TonB family protein [Hymenobacter sp. HDW8]QIL76269.1 TonB family protein [Hymenobacter sp. HDW8]
MLTLPILNVRIQPCGVGEQHLSPQAQGHHCALCDRLVQDFTRSTQTDLEQARAASPDGRVCGRFTFEQLVPSMRMRPKLRRFLVALMLVCGLGLTRHEALAQVQKAAHQCSQHSDPVLKFETVEDLSPVALLSNQEQLLAPIGSLPKPKLMLGMITEVMPVYKNGGSDGLRRFIQENLKYPIKSMPVGKVFVNFIVTKTGQVKDFRIVKSLEPAADLEVLRVMQLMGPWKPGYQLDRAVDVSYTMPITFARE